MGSAPEHRIAPLLAAGAYLVAALFLLYPTWLAPGHGVVGDWMHPDMISNHWLYRWVADQAWSGGTLLHNEAYYLPVGDAPWLAGNGSDALPYALLAAWLPWPASMTAWATLILVLNGLAGYALSRALGASQPASLVGGAALLFLPYAAFELGCARFAQAPLYWMGFFLWAWLRLLHRPSWRRGVVAGLLFGATAFGYWYYGLWMVLAGGVLFLFQRRWRALPVFAGVALVTTLPPLAVFLWGWSRIPGTLEGAYPHELALQSGLWPLFPLWGGTGPYLQLTLPLLVGILAALGARSRWSHPAVRGLVAVAGLFYLLALGPHLLGPAGADTGVPLLGWVAYAPLAVLRRFWWPYRHLAVLGLALAPLAALGADRALGGFGRGRWAVALGLCALLPVDLASRAGLTSVVGSWWEAPEAYTLLEHLPPGALLELPVALEVAQTQQSLSYQWIHGRPLVNGHAMWVRRVRPEAWDQWLDAQPPLAAIAARERGELRAPAPISQEQVDALLDQGVRYVSVNDEFFPGELTTLRDEHLQLLEDLLGEPVVDQDMLRVWDLDRYTGLQRIEPGGFTLGERELDPTGRPASAEVHSLGWRPLERALPPQLPPPEVVRTEEDRALHELSLPPMIRRKLQRERAREQGSSR